MLPEESSGILSYVREDYVWIGEERHTPDHGHTVADFEDRTTKIVVVLEGIVLTLSDFMFAINSGVFILREGIVCAVNLLFLLLD